MIQSHEVYTQEVNLRNLSHKINPQTMFIPFLLKIQK
jgi:hypothetical protein